MMLAQAEHTALELLDRIKTGYEYLPSFLKPSCVEWNKKSIKFSNRSTISGFASSSNGPRGQSMNVLILDEFAFLPHKVEDKLFTSVYPVISQDPNGKVFLISTPNGCNNLFYKIWQQAKSKDADKNLDGWRPFQMFYWQVPGHDTPEWKAAQIAAIGEQRFQQEYNCSFIEFSQIKKLISDDIIEKYRIRLTENKNKNINQGKDLAILSKDGTKTYAFTMYEDFNPDETYLASFDVSEGIKKDASVLYIWKITETSNIKQCLKFSSNEVSPLEFAYISNELLKLYANPFLAGESNGISLGYIEQLRVIYGYEHFVMMGKQGNCGIDSHVQNRTRAVLWFRDMMTTMGFGFEIFDFDIVDEMSTFVKRDTKVHEIFGAIGENHDDHLMAMIWMTWILNNDNINHYFVVSDTFTSSLGVVYPKNVQPIFEYENAELKYILENDNVKTFQFYKQMMLNNKDYQEQSKKTDDNIREQFKLLGQKIMVENGKVENTTNKIDFNSVNKQQFSQDDYLRQKRNKEKLDQIMGVQTGGFIIADVGGSGDNYDFNNQAASIFGWDDEPMW